MQFLKKCAVSAVLFLLHISLPFFYNTDAHRGKHDLQAYLF